MGISASKLIKHFQTMYDDKWGYIYGKSGQKWTQAMQNAATNDMAKKYGSKWIGHYVTDCSGAFVWAFKQEGGSIYHGSNTIWNKYCTAKGSLKNGARTDGQPIKPGTAVFLYRSSDNNRHHIGLYVGNDTVIEAKGTQYGVVVSRLNHWDEWGELKDVDYGNTEGVVIEPERRMLRSGCRGDDVKELQTILEKAGFSPQGIDGIFGKNTLAAVKAFQKDRGLSVDGIVGPLTWAELDKVSALPEKLYNVTITGVTKTEADKLKKTYPQAVVA